MSFAPHVDASRKIQTCFIACAAGHSTPDFICVITEGISIHMQH